MAPAPILRVSIIISVGITPIGNLTHLTLAGLHLESPSFPRPGTYEQLLTFLERAPTLESITIYRCFPPFPQLPLLRDRKYHQAPASKIIVPARRALRHLGTSETYRSEFPYPTGITHNVRQQHRGGVLCPAAAGRGYLGAHKANRIPVHSLSISSACLDFQSALSVLAQRHIEAPDDVSSSGQGACSKLVPSWHTKWDGNHGEVPLHILQDLLALFDLGTLRSLQLGMCCPLWRAIQWREIFGQCVDLETLEVVGVPAEHLFCALPSTSQDPPLFPRLHALYVREVDFEYPQVNVREASLYETLLSALRTRKGRELCKGVDVLDIHQCSFEGSIQSAKF